MSKDTTELRPIPIIHGLDCPACGHSSLMLGDGGYVTCAIEECPNPDYAEALKALISNREKLARIDENDYHWHRQKAIELDAKNGGVSGYFLERKATLRKELYGGSDE